MPPMLREEPGVLALGKAVVEEQHHALIFLRPVDPAQTGRNLDPSVQTESEGAR